MSKFLAKFLLFGTLFLSGLFSAASAEDFTVAVQVADPGDRQRSSAYWLALNQILQTKLPAGVIDEAQRQEILREPSRYVQSFRYRAYNAAADGRLLATRQVREGAPPDSVIIVTFPATLPGIIQRQTQVQVVEEEIVITGSGRVLALIAVEQNGNEFLVGGNRAKKFQSRMIQLGAANNITFEFPVLDEQDLAIISPVNVLYDDKPVLAAMVEKYQASGFISGGLISLSEQSWQSTWQYSVAGGEPRNLSLTTGTLDEALLTAVSEVAGGNTAASGYLANAASYDRRGVAVRVENINSLVRHQQVLELLRTIDPQVTTEGFEPGVTTYRTPNSDAFKIQQNLAGQSALTPLNSAGAGPGSDSTIAYRLR